MVIKLDKIVLCVWILTAAWFFILHISDKRLMAMKDEIIDKQNYLIDKQHRLITKYRERLRIADDEKGQKNEM